MGEIYYIDDNGMRYRVDDLDRDYTYAAISAGKPCPDKLNPPKRKGVQGEEEK